MQAYIPSRAHSKQLGEESRFQCSEEDSSFFNGELLSRPSLFRWDHNELRPPRGGWINQRLVGRGKVSLLAQTWSQQRRCLVTPVLRPKPRFSSTMGAGLRL